MQLVYTVTVWLDLGNDNIYHNDNLAHNDNPQSGLCRVWHAMTTYTDMTTLETLKLLALDFCVTIFRAFGRICVG